MGPSFWGDGTLRGFGGAAWILRWFILIAVLRESVRSRSRCQTYRVEVLGPHWSCLKQRLISERQISAQPLQVDKNFVTIVWDEAYPDQKLDRDDIKDIGLEILETDSEGEVASDSD